MTDTTLLSADYEGSVSEGTHNPRHLVPRFVEILERVNPRHELVEEYRVLDAAFGVIAQFTGDRPEDIADFLGVWETEHMSHFLNDGLFEALNEIAPKGCSFGSSEGDGASFGFWRYEDEDADDE